MHIVRNHPPKYFQVHIFMSDWVLGAMTFQLPLNFTLDFPTQTSWFDMIVGNLPSLVSKELMFIISAQSDGEIQSYWSPSAGSKYGH